MTVVPREAADSIASGPPSVEGRLRSVTASLFAADFKPRLELLTCMKRDDPPRRNESRFTGFRIPAGTL
jgi:hypothetical protein